MSQFFPARTPCLHRMTSGEKNPLMQGYSHALEVSMALQKDPAQVGGPDSQYQGIRVCAAHGGSCFSSYSNRGIANSLAGSRLINIYISVHGDAVYWPALAAASGLNPRFFIF